MRVKRTARKGSVVNHEQVKMAQQDGTEDQNLQFLLNSPQISNDIDHNLMVNMDLVHVQNELHDDLSSYSTINEIRTIDPSVMEDTIHLPKDCLIEQGQKRPFEQINNVTVNETASHTSAEVPNDEAMKFKKRCEQLETEIQKLKVESMPKPTESNVIQYFINMGNILRNDIENRNSVEELSISEISQMLNIETNELLKRKKRTSTATVRSIIKMLYPCPEPSFTYTSIDKSIIDAIIKYAKIANPNNMSSDTELRRAISNYFSYLTHQRKIKELAIINQNTKAYENDIDKFISS